MSPALWKFCNQIILAFKMWITTWSLWKPDWYILCSWIWRSSIQTAKTKSGADCGSDHEILIAKFILKLKKEGKTTRTFRYDLSQIPYDHTAEVTNRFKRLDLKIEYLKNYGQRFVTLYMGHWSKPQEKEMQKGKMVVWRRLTNSWEKKRSKRQRRQGKI